MSQTNKYMSSVHKIFQLKIQIAQLKLSFLLLLQSKIVIGAFSQNWVICYPSQEYYEKWVELNILIWIMEKGRCVLKKTRAKVCQYNSLIKGKFYRETHNPGII